ncbi:MAG TPA: hypothetical protein VEY96_11290, partial [Actinomycetes bacterium]|nr:hypothetical protein [Actinomycetes bacterium]
EAVGSASRTRATCGLSTRRAASTSRPEAGGEPRVAGELGPEGLDGGQAAAAAFPAEEDDPHATLAEAAEQLVGAEPPGVARLLR